MRYKWIVAIVFLALSCADFSLEAHGRRSRYSHRGIKGSLGLGSTELESKDLQDGDGISLSLGYGFNHKSTLWLSLIGSEHLSKSFDRPVTEFNGLELIYQHKIRTKRKVQPYGKIGLGIYQQHERHSSETIFGGGVTWALGADYAFTRHFSIGLELSFKDVEFTKRSIEQNGGDFVTDLNPRLNRDFDGLMITFVFQ